jgi:hypothetical protein
MMTTKFTKTLIWIAAVALGAAMISGPALAYEAVPGYNSQGAVIALPHGAHHSASLKSHRHLYNQSLPKGGRTVE